MFRKESIPFFSDPEVLLQRLPARGPLQPLGEPLLVASHVFQFVTLLLQERGDPGFDLLSEDGDFPRLRDFRVIGVRRRVGGGEGEEVGEPRRRAGEGEDPAFPAGECPDPGGEVALLVPADEVAQDFVQRIGAFPSPRRRLVRDFPPDAGHVFLQCLRDSVPPAREDPRRVVQRHIGQEDPRGPGQRAVRDPGDDFPDPALLVGYRAQRFEDRPVAVHVDQVGVAAEQFGVQEGLRVLRVRAAGDEVDPYGPIVRGDGKSRDPHPLKVFPEELAETGRRRRVRGPARREVDAAQFRVGGQEQPILPRPHSSRTISFSPGW